MQEMRLLLGPPGSGKTSRLLDEVRRHARAGRGDFRYLAPTATLRDHIANLLAREGLLVRPSTIATIAGFLEEVTPGMDAASDEDLLMLTARAIGEKRPAALESLRGSPGLAAALAATVDELASAGCGPGEWAALGSLGVWEGARLRALGEIYEAVEEQLRAQGLARRAGLLAEAARRVAQRGLAGVRHVYLDGFFTLSPYELKLVEALAKQAHVEVALPEWVGAREAVEHLRAAGFRIERLISRRTQPDVVLCSATNEEREAGEIALRITEARREGFAWRECGVILRNRLPYGPLLETTFARFGIPWRAYCATPLMEHSAARCLAALVEACLANWEHEAVLRALSEPSCVSARLPSFSRFQRAVCEALPGEGFDALMKAAEPEVAGFLVSLSGWAGGDGVRRLPAEWVESLAGLVPMLQPPAPGSESAWRGAAVDTFLRVAGQVARLLPVEAMELPAFWDELRPVLLGASLRDPGRRRDAVHLLDAYEARQWELPVVFVCGLKEGEFPRRPAVDPILSEAVRLRLRQQGIPVSLASGREAEERFLFEIAQTRATHRLVYSWPQFESGGDPALRSIALDLLTAREQTSRRVQIKPAAERQPLPPVALDDHHVRDRLASKFAVHSVTALESYLQCPFQFFLRYTVEPQGAPERPSERLNPLFTGNVLHQVLKDWHQSGAAMDRIFDSVWTRGLARNRIPRGHAAEFTRSVLRRSLVEYAANMIREAGWRTFTEEGFELELNGCRVKGRIDRFDINGKGQARVFDFKFSSDTGIRNRQRKQEEGLALQGGLYLLALRRQGYEPVSFEYVGVKNGLSIRGWDDAEQLTLMMNEARARAEEAVFRILQGRIEVNPQDRSACAWCDFIDVCRIQSAQRAERAEAAG